ncbi:MAG: nucleotidyltransferase, partial [FCB group bacterium]|nr:nucleotidyltransferase [FCB group bacterium]
MKPSETKGLRSHEDVLEAIVKTIDIPENLDHLARERYQSIGNWLDRDASTIKQYDPEVSPQGSFLLGTVIRPIGDADEYDIDLVCTLKSRKQDFSMAKLKGAVGTEIIRYAEAAKMKNEPEDRRRCG